MSGYGNKQGSGGDAVYWLIAIGLLITGLAAPVGVVMIAIKLFGGKTKRGRHPYYEDRRAPDTRPGARTTAPQAEQPVKKGRSGKKAQASPLSGLIAGSRRLAKWSAAAAAVCAFLLAASLGDAGYWLLHGEAVWFFEELLEMLPFLLGLAGGLGCVAVGVNRQRRFRRYEQYLAMVGKRRSLSLATLASATGESQQRLRRDLQEMLALGLFPTGFLDLGSDRLVLSGEGLSEEPPKAPEQPEPPEEDAVLLEIRAVNDAIDNEKLSGQIDRIGVITAKILDYQRAHPERSPELHSFLSYYLPTTLKILRSYARLEEQEVTGENIAAAMERIEGMMDKVVEGFEKQLDLLFQGDAMDIAADVAVLERMLAKDGLSDQSGLTLGL